MPQGSILLRKLLLVLLVALGPQGSRTSDSKLHTQFLKSHGSVRRLLVCGWCAHGSRNFLSCDCDEGWEGRCCDTRVELYDGQEFVLQRIRNDEVEQELAFARNGSDLPRGLHGIFWMDQRGVNVASGIHPVDPDYQQAGSQAADELVVSFGETHWDAETRCAGPVPVAGGRKGHWTFMDQQGPLGTGNSSIWESAVSSHLYADFCFRSDSFDEIDLYMYVKMLGVHIRIPWLAAHLSMKKTAWGWDRQTTSLVTGSKVFHYPVFQIVDGLGRRTEHYDAYLNWANKDTLHTVEGFDSPINRGNGTSLVGRLSA